MKKLLLLSILCCLSMIAAAQFKILENGHAQIGTNPPIDESLYIAQQDTTVMLKIFGPYGDMRTGSRLSFGDITRYNSNVVLGELGTGDSDQLWVQAKNGYYFTFGHSASDTVVYFDLNKGNYFKFNCELRATGYYTPSDSRLKDDITPVESSLDGLSQLSAVSFRFKSPYDNAQGYSAQTANSASPKAVVDAQNMARFKESIANDSIHYGFIAQEVKEIYPELVRTDADGYMYVDYMGMIPLLVNALNEMQAEITYLQAELEGRDAPSVYGTGGIDDTIAEITPRLFQNSPNPFDAVTEIKYELPESVSNAAIYIYDLKGTQVKRINLQGRGMGTVTIEGSELSAGMYIYALIADGQEIDTKRMILTK